MSTEAFPVVRASELAPERLEQRWLIRDLWAVNGVGLVAGHPKSYKTWLGLEMAVSLASATPCLGTHAVERRGCVLLYLAEDAHHIVKERLESLCRCRGVELAGLDIFVITASSLRIDLPSEQLRLTETVTRVQPDMLLLDPLVRLHAIDENSAGEVSRLLSFLRQLQRERHTAVVLVHHARKNGSQHPGLSLRGSSDLHAFGDTNLYLQRRHQRLVLTVEHRAAPSPEPVELELVGGDTPHLEHRGRARPPDDQLTQAVQELLSRSATPMTRSAIRDRLQARNERVGTVLQKLEQQGSVKRDRNGWVTNRP